MISINPKSFLLDFWGLFIKYQLFTNQKDSINI